MKDPLVHKAYWYLSLFQLVYIVMLIALSYAKVENESITFLIRFIGEILTIPVVVGVFFCLVYFGLKLFNEKPNNRYVLLFSINALTAGLMIIFTILQT